jgi:FkbM family methyltransferase
MTVLSYAQNAEDIVLARAFPRGHLGFYIDVGAADPVVHSVTKYFYDRGWNGVNIEPSLTALELLSSARTRDVNLGVALGQQEETAKFYELPPAMVGCSTRSGSLAEHYRREGWTVEEREVPIVTLASVCDEHVGGRTIDFLKVDVEGDEAAVLAGANFERYRPRVVLVEATVPGGPVPAHEDWEHLLLSAHFTFALFDGLNRFYVREEDGDLLEALGAPANCLDDYISHDCAQWKQRAERVERIESERRTAEEKLRNELRAAQDAATAANRATAEASARARALDDALEHTRTQLAASQSALSDVRTELEHTRTQLAASQSALSDVRTELEHTRRQLAASRSALRDARTELEHARAALTVRNAAITSDAHGSQQHT